MAFVTPKSKLGRGRNVSTLTILKKFVIRLGKMYSKLLINWLFLDGKVTGFFFFLFSSCSSSENITF